MESLDNIANLNYLKDGCPQRKGKDRVDFLLALDLDQKKFWYWENAWFNTYNNIYPQHLR